ncbi:MAG: ankyrin repeat domain-containing protein, partial [Pseudomonadota bacterium]
MAPIPRPARALVGIALPITILMAQADENCGTVEDPWLEANVAARQSDLFTLECRLADLDINDVDPTDIWENTLLHFAAKYNQAPAVYFLASKGADLEVKNAVDHTPLLVAAKEGATEAAKILIQQGASVGSADIEGRTVLFWAIASEKPELVALLLRHGAKPDRLIELNGNQTSPRNYANNHNNPIMKEVILIHEK